MPGYTLPNETLKNKLGATNPDDLETLESELVAARLTEIALGAGPTGNFDLDHLRALHRHLFQDVYEWAGHTRDERVRLSDGEIAHEPTLRKSEGEPFVLGPLVTRSLNQTFQQLAAEDLRALDREGFAKVAASVLAALNSVHAFREGNGRTQRAFMVALAKEAGHELRFDVVSRERMTQISIAAHEQGDLGGFERMMREITDPDRVSALRQAQDYLDQHRSTIDWRDRYMATTEEGRSYSLTLVGTAGPNFMARTDAEILVGRSSDLPSPPPASGERFTMTTAVRQELQARDSGERVLDARGINISAVEGERDEQKPSGQKI